MSAVFNILYYISLTIIDNVLWPGMLAKKKNKLATDMATCLPFHIKGIVNRSLTLKEMEILQKYRSFFDEKKTKLIF